MVSIALVMNSGIITKSKTAVDKYSQEEIQEQIKLAYAEWQTAQWTSDAGDAATFIKNRLKSTFNLQDNEIDVDVENEIVTVTMNGKDYAYDTKAGSLTVGPAVAKAKPGEAVPEGTTAVYKSNGKTAVIPAGYTISNTTAEQSIDTGLVITKDGNEWVWIPVSSTDLVAMYTEDSTGWTMTGTGVVTKYKSNGNIIAGKDRGNPGATTFNEPNVLNEVGYDVNDRNVSNLSSAGLGTNVVEAATKLRDDYKAMIDSIKKYGGFYIGRYELSNAGTKKNQPSLTNTKWYNLYKKCRDIESTSNVVVSTMIFGCQWDQVCKFIETAKDANGDTISLTDSRKYGNYSNSQAPANTGNYVQKQKQNTGSNEAWKTNNIYDLAGNCSEWTQEACGNGYRAYRGGNFGEYGYNLVTSRSDGLNPETYRVDFSSRPVLYLK